MRATEASDAGTEAIDPNRLAYTLKDVARLLEVSERHVRYLVAKGDLPSFKVGSAVRVYGAALWDYARGRAS